MRGITTEAVMLYLAAVFFVLALALIGADLAGVRAAHGAGVTGTLCFLVALALVAAKEFSVESRQHRHG
jgi:hypothetical protein